jgi:hypothetical protein
VTDDPDRMTRWLAISRYNTLDDQPTPVVQAIIEKLYA